MAKQVSLGIMEQSVMRQKTVSKDGPPGKAVVHLVSMAVANAEMTAKAKLDEGLAGVAVCAGAGSEATVPGRSAAAAPPAGPGTPGRCAPPAARQKQR